MLKRGALFFLLACSVVAAETPPKGINIQQRMMVLESDGSKLKVNELYTVEYNSVAPRNKTAHVTLKIYLPGGATVEQATARPAGSKSSTTAIVPQAEQDLYAFTYPIRPGVTQFTVKYTLPYGGQLKITPRVTSATGQLLLVAPNSMGLAPDEDSVYTRANDPMLKDVTVLVASAVTGQHHLGIEVSGVGTLARASKERPTAPQSGQPPDAGRRPDDAGTQGQGSARGSSAQWIFLGVLFLFLAAAATYAYAANHAARPAAAPPAEDSLIAAIKEEMFQLESDRIQGKLSPEEYDTAKAGLEKTLRKAAERAARP